MDLRIETIAIGDELLTGKIADTNSAFVGDQLFRHGLCLTQQTVVGDDVGAMRSAFSQVGARADVAICFGGLGPTSDDKTVDCVAELLQSDVEVYEPSRERLLNHYKVRERSITPESLRQLRYPLAAKPFPNPVGLAPGFSCTFGNCVFYFLPGVPTEMRPMVCDFVFSQILAKTKGNHSGKIRSHFWRCLGLPESELQRRVNEVEGALPKQAWLGFRTHYPENQLTLYWREHENEANVNEKSFDYWCGKIASLLEGDAYTEEYASLEETLIHMLRRSGRTLAVAESCTGGLVAHRLTQIPGSSQVFWGGYTCYQPEAKKAMLGVSTNAKEAVSRQVTAALAEQVREQSGASIGAAITGYMGPIGGEKDRPVGTVYIAVVGRALREKHFVLQKPMRESLKWGASSFLLYEILQE